MGILAVAVAVNVVYGDFFDKLDANEDGGITKEEYMSWARAWAEGAGQPFNEKKTAYKFSQLDADSDGVVTRQEYDAAQKNNQELTLG